MYRTLTILTISLIFFTINGRAQAPAAESAPAQNSAKSKSPGRKKPFRPTKSQISSAQEKLKASGLYFGPAEGRYTVVFRTSLRSYQRANGLGVSGRLDRATVVKLGIPLTDRQKGIAPAKRPGSKRVVFRVTKDQISQAQRLLTTQDRYSGQETGRYSKELRSAIRDFQSDNGLRRTGALNRVTLEKMGIALNDQQRAIPANPDHVASRNSGKRTGRRIFRATKDQISEVQRMLKTKGLYSGPETGKLSKETRAAIKEWQAQNKVKTTGTLNKVTLEAMGIALTERQKAM